MDERWGYETDLPPSTQTWISIQNTAAAAVVLVVVVVGVVDEACKKP